MLHTWVEQDEREWVTEIVGHKTPESLTVSVRVDCNLLVPGLKLPKPNKPYIVRLLLSEFGGGVDGGLKVSDAPTMLSETDIDIAVRLITGTFGNRLPAVYVSATRDGTHCVDPSALARQLSGMCHVVVEPSRHFSWVLARQVQYANAYGGAVSVYWPAGAGRQLRLLPHKFETADDFERQLSDSVTKSLTHLRPTSRCSWAFLRELVSRARIEALKAAGSTELTAYVEAFDSEAEAKEERLQLLEQEVNRLRAEVARHAAAAEFAGEGLIKAGSEREFYAGEYHDVLVQGLRLARDQFQQNCRRQHLVDSLLKNNQVTEFEEEFEEDLKRALSGSDDFGTSERRAMETLGFDLDESGKHIKAIYQTDSRYLFTISKTGSDFRGMKNLTSQILRTLFR